MKENLITASIIAVRNPRRGAFEKHRIKEKAREEN